MTSMLADLRIATLARGVVVVSWSHQEARALTTAEAAVVAFAADGLSNAEIARQRGTSVRTVANLLARAYKKLGAGSRTSAAAHMMLARPPR